MLNEIKNRHRILVIAAHPDDEILGCGGTMAKFVDQGKEVSVLILGEGITSRSTGDQSTNRNRTKLLRNSCIEANQILGVTNLIFENLPDNRLDTLPLLDIVKKIEETISKIKPHIVFTHHSSDLNIDHSITHRATLTACRPTGDISIEELYAYEVPSSTEWSFNQFHPNFQPNFFNDISGTLDKKIEAMKMYRSELRKFPHPRSVEILRATAMKWGSMAGLKAVEAFQLIFKICH